MIFNEPQFLVFFAIVFALHWVLRRNRSRKLVLLAASYVFYGAWDWRFLFLILGSTVIDYVIGLQIERCEDIRKRRRWLVASLVANLSVLGFFKYFNFFIESGTGLLQMLGVELEPRTFGIVLPVGISFFTFQTMSYSIDIYRRKLAATRDFWDFALFVAFFPQLVAGPIVRAAEFLPQLRTSKLYAAIPFREAFAMFLIGFVKKACVADGIAPHVEAVYADPAAYDALSMWLATLLYAVQIYCDFSGYSEMAIACALLLGYRLCKNFDSPYFALHITEFWRRWHISLSSWLRDYLYISLGGNRGSRAFVFRNLLLTMLLGGLWHGAGWNFVVWGLLHGIALIAHKVWGDWRGEERPLALAPLTWALTAYWVCVAWIFFRAETFEIATVIVRAFVLVSGPVGEASLDRNLWWLLLGLIAAHWLAYRGVHQRIGRCLPDPAIAFVWGVVVAVSLYFVPVGHRPFIYFQF